MERKWRELSLLAEVELDCLSSIIKIIPEGDIIMAGCYKGGDVIEIKRTCPDRNVIVIDSFEGADNPEPEDLVNVGIPRFKGECSADMREVIRNFTEHDIQKPFQIHRMWISDAALNLIVRRPLAMIWLDLDHYRPTLECMRYFWPWLQRGGVMLTHDYGFVRCPGVKQACDEFGETWVKLAGNIFGARKV
jgi:O-methyltransferase